MLAVRYVALAALAVWLGGIVTIGLLVTPITSRILEAVDPTAGAALATALVAIILSRFHLLAYGCGALIVLCLLAMKFVGPPPRAFVARIVIVVTMLVLEAASGLPLAREMRRLQPQVSGGVDRPATGDARRQRFEQLYRASAALMMMNGAFGAVLLFWYVRE